MKTIIAALPGFRAQTQERSEPIIAWLIADDGAHGVSVTPIGVAGLCDDGAAIVGPDGEAIE